MINPFPRINRVGRRILRRTQYPLDQMLINLSAVRHPGPSRKAIFRRVASMRQGLLLYLEGLEGAVQSWDGAAIDTGDPLRVAYLGDERAMRFNSPLYLQHILFSAEPSSVTSLDRFPMVRAREEAERLAGDYDLIIVESNGRLLWQPPSGQWVSTPNWIRMEFVFEEGETWEHVQQRFRAHKNNVKRVLHNGFQYRISHVEEDFDLFYDHMYVPLISNRYGEYGAIDHKDSMRDQFHKGFLFMIDDAEGRPIAAQLCYLYRKTLYSISSGILEGDPELHSKGALSAIYYFSLCWCHENGMERFEMGSCRPFQTDGLYQYKQRWGMTPTPDLWGAREWLLWAPNNAPAAVDWLNAHPVVSLAEYWSNQPAVVEGEREASPEG